MSLSDEDRWMSDEAWTLRRGRAEAKRRNDESANNEMNGVFLNVTSSWIVETRMCGEANEDCCCNVIPKCGDV